MTLDNLGTDPVVLLFQGVPRHMESWADSLPVLTDSTGTTRFIGQMRPSHQDPSGRFRSMNGPRAKFLT